MKADAGLRFDARIEAVLADPARDLLVLADKYPPKSVGGAEVSLHLVMRQAAFVSRVVVAVFDPDVPVPRLYHQDGVPVLALPDAAGWPLHRRTIADYRRALARGKGARARLEYAEGAKVLLAGGPLRDLPDRASAMAFLLGREPAGGVAFHFALGPRSGWLRARAVGPVIAAMRPRAVLLDNARSILLAEAVRAACPDLRLVAVVRDNRFHCARQSQSVSIDGVACTTCAFGCAPHDAEGGRLRTAFHRRHLRKTAARRQAALRVADLVVVTSRYLERSVAPLVPPGRLRRIPNPGEDVSMVARAIRGVGEAPGENVVVVGMLNEAKGQLRFVREAADWLRGDPARRIHLAGRGEATARRIAAFAEEAGLSRQIVLHGFLGRADVLRLMRSCQVVAAPTLWPEPFGRTPLEAGLARRPVVAFAKGGLAESIVDGETGFLVAPDDYAAFLDRVGRLMADPALRTAMGTAGALHIGRLFSVERSTDLLEALFRDLGRGEGDRPVGPNLANFRQVGTS